MGGNRDDEHRDLDGVLERQIRSHFEMARRDVPVPAFDAVMAKAEADCSGTLDTSALGWVRDLFAARRRMAVWAGATAATAVLLVYAFVGTGGAQQPPVPDATMLARLPAAVSVSAQELIAALNRTTRWRAPSDRWPTAEADLDILGLPELGLPAVPPEEQKTWL